MRIAIASGKGGTGKTTVATNLALVASMNGQSVRLLDCDVEEPNCHIFLKPEITRTEAVNCPVPAVHMERCNLCGQCGEICQFSAIVVMPDKVLTFPELCHSCAGCWLVCPEKAIEQDSRHVGDMRVGMARGFQFVYGQLRVGEAMSPPLIREVIRQTDDESLTLMDAPPGTSCPVVTVVRDADYVCLVTEPTPFGLSDLEMAVEMVRAVGRRCGVIINRADVGDDRVRAFCQTNGLPVLAEIPDDRRVAECYSRGQLVAEALPELAAMFRQLLAVIQREATPCATTTT